MSSDGLPTSCWGPQGLNIVASFVRAFSRLIMMVVMTNMGIIGHPSAIGVLVDKDQKRQARIFGRVRVLD